ncbi:MAG: glutamate-5-semialdehyde dehydrogenase [Erysipelotrichaceae bacterium]|nr:glutamate-5-semialdehyde dehydrogenase [Erysipelotrichaceae bacterium]
MSTLVQQLGKQAQVASRVLAKLTTQQKNEILMQAADALLEHCDEILEANAQDLERAKQNDMPKPLQDRLMLTKARVEAIAKGMQEVAQLEDPVGQFVKMEKRPNGLYIMQKRVPFGVIAVIYEARPNVTADVFALCFKSGNATILKGGKDAASSNLAIVNVLQQALRQAGLTEHAVQLLEDNSREASRELMRCHEYVDVLIPRGGAGLIRSVIETATVPVIETGTGNCHVFVDDTADLDMAASIIVNGKTQRVGVCNAVESLLVTPSVAKAVCQRLDQEFAQFPVKIHAEQELLEYFQQNPKFLATPEDWGTEYLDYEISIKVVDDLDEAIAHINRYNTRHSECIITQDFSNAEQFLDEVDAAAVYVNASTRFTDGHEFGLGAEIGISTQKLHARGPMGLQALTTTKFVIYGNGQVRP